jgi:ribosomal protein L18E
VTPSIKKRTAVIGSYGAWEDVTVSSTSFTATDTTKTIDNGGDPIELDHVQGYEYQITGVNIEKKA